ncbi:hypothetical protein IV417_12505 [Alphaproteobacteria bacterium KMM 3653]|uniref:Uncharacterized protein n=1 Tax=Harenicola maris TaxID=2841044 RepID=A0AAP2G8D4_9RHOB|nr:hypothetical protein [Harenicola maris]
MERMPIPFECWHKFSKDSPAYNREEVRVERAVQDWVRIMVEPRIALLKQYGNASNLGDELEDFWKSISGSRSRLFVHMVDKSRQEGDLMTKDSLYYMRRLQKVGYERNKRMTAGKTPEEIYEILDELNADTSEDWISRIGQNQDEAFAIIRAMIDDPYPSDPDKIYSLKWQVFVAKGTGYFADREGDFTRAQMLERLHWISSEEFGEDIAEWIDWMTAFEANPAPFGFR